MSSQHSSSSSSHPLRPYYHPTPPEQQRHWITPTSSSSPAAASASSSGTNSGSLQHLMASSSSTTTRPRSSSYLLASRPISVIPDYDLELTGSAEQFNLSLLLRGYLSAGMMAFTSAAMVMPFEVGKTLLQVQWIPAHDPSAHISLPQPSTEDYLEDDEEDDNLDTYFTQQKPPLRPSIGSTISKRTVSSATSATRAASRTRQEGVEEEWPEWVLPVVVERGVADMIRAISRWRGEGFLGLWKGQLTAFIIDTVSSKVQPILLATLFLLGSTPSAASLPLEHQAYPGLPLALSVGSYLATGLLLAPLDLVRTRLIVQSSQLRHRAYTGPIDALKTIIRTEGGLRNLFFHPALLLPALLDNLLRPLLHLATPLLIDRIFGLDRAQESVRYGLAELGLSSAALLLVLPLETIRKRLQLQSRANPSSFPEVSSSVPPLKACVRLRPKPYNGMVETFYRIVTEEKAGFWGLFRGFNVGITANVVVFFLSILGNPPIADHPSAPFGSGGWAEV